MFLSHSPHRPSRSSAPDLRSGRALEQRADGAGNDAAHAHGHGGLGGHGHGHGGLGGHGHGGTGAHGGLGGHGHGGSSDTSGTAFAVATGLNVVFVVVEATYGVLSQSTALLADAIHNLSDVLGLVLAWVASRLARAKPSQRRTYGMRKSTVLAALANALLLFVSVGVVLSEAFERLTDAQPIAATSVLVVASVGVLINGLSALLFIRGAKHDVNLRGAFLHLVADAAVSLGVVGVGAVLLWRPTWVWLDPAVSLVISLVILWGTWGLLTQALHLTLDGVPEHVPAQDIGAYLRELPGVEAVHDLHIWALSTSEVALTAHLVVDPRRAPPGLATTANQHLARRFGIAHSTIQLETLPESGDCAHC